MFLPTFLIQKLTVKWTLVFAISGYTLYIGLQAKPEFYTLIPAAVRQKNQSRLNNTGLC